MNTLWARSHCPPSVGVVRAAASARQRHDQACRGCAQRESTHAPGRPVRHQQRKHQHLDDETNQWAADGGQRHERGQYQQQRQVRGVSPIHGPAATA
jgi:hypothetical protein